MAKILGIGGIFFKSKVNAATTGAWYEKHLGIPIMWPTGSAFSWQLPKEEGVAENHNTIWSPFAAETTYFRNINQQYMINYIVDDIEEMVAQLEEQGVTVSENKEDGEYGKFQWAQDGDGIWMELWQPPAK